MKRSLLCLGFLVILGCPGLAQMDRTAPAFYVVLNSLTKSCTVADKLPRTDTPNITVASDRLDASSSVASMARPLAPQSSDTSPARILLLTDGANSAGSNPLDAASKATEARVPVYTVLLGNDQGRSGELSPTETLSALANQTGGVFTQSSSTADLNGIGSSRRFVVLRPSMNSRVSTADEPS